MAGPARRGTSLRIGGRITDPDATLFERGDLRRTGAGPGVLVGDRSGDRSVALAGVDCGDCARRSAGGIGRTPNHLVRGPDLCLRTTPTARPTADRGTL